MEEKTLEVIKAEQMLEKIEEKNKSSLGDLMGGFLTIAIGMITLQVFMESISKAFKDDNTNIKDGDRQKKAR